MEKNILGINMSVRDQHSRAAAEEERQEWRVTTAESKRYPPGPGRSPARPGHGQVGHGAGHKAAHSSAQARAEPQSWGSWGGNVQGDPRCGSPGKLGLCAVWGLTVISL